VIQLDAVHKSYGRDVALSGVDLKVPAGTIFGFLGPNGAGKTTTLRMLIGLLRATSGSMTVLGLDPWEQRERLHQRVGYLPSGMGFYEMTGRDMLKYTASLMSGEARTSPLRGAALEALALSEKVLDRELRSYSKGMKQKIAIAQAVQHDPELLLLDEPTEGLDPLVQHAFAELLRERRDAGRTIFFSSHTLSEVQSLCDHVAIIRQGAIVASSTYEEMVERHPRVVRVTGVKGGRATIDALGEAWRIVRSEGDLLVVHTTVQPMEIVEVLAGLEFEDVTIEQPSLEDVFLSYYEAGTP
jgi:ABC-2 type transport system ATP-binding protein